MEIRDHSGLLAELAQAYREHSPRSGELNRRAEAVMIDGGSHALRLIEPFPPRIVTASGAYLTDEDGHRILDFWQGHFANILGHNPPVVTKALAQAFADGWGLQTGFTDRVQIEVAELLCRQTGAERVRFTTSGALATMYAIMLARTYTGREMILKIGGGWHGAQPWALKGVQYDAARGFDAAYGAGIPSEVTDRVLVTRFNDVDDLRRQFASHGDRLACLIVEPFIGAGGGIPATCEYLRTARALTQQYGALLIFDEVIAGFRFRAGDAGRLYGVQPDLATFGKVIAGGMPAAAVAGREDVLALAGRGDGLRVKFSGGTYSAHPATMLAARTMLGYLVEHEAEIYPRLSEMGERARAILTQAFASEGIHVICTGAGNDALPPSSMIEVHFPYREDTQLLSPDDTLNPAVCDHVLGETVLRLALLLEDVHTTHGFGALSAAHTDADLDVLAAAVRRVAHRLRPYLNRD